MTWKQFVQRVEQQLRSNGVSPDKQPIDIAYIDVGRSDAIDVDVRTADMPERCEIAVTGGW